MDFAAKVRDWPLLQQAITLKLNEQEDFVNWWEGAVTPRKGGDRGNQYTEPKAQIGAFGKDEAEAETGISHQQVSRWRKRLKTQTGVFGSPTRARERHDRFLIGF